jgi:transcriptional regulator with XRE-family HTH domain
MSGDFGKRLQDALDSAGKTRAQLAAVLRSTDDTMGVSPSAIGQVISGATKALTAENCARAARFLGVSNYWLATGLGPMRDQPAASGLVVAERPPTFGLDDEALVTALRAFLRRLEPAMRVPVADLLHAWARDGGVDDRSEALLRLVGPSEKQQPARRTSGI